jgi:uncharacterized protein with NAD-binding domain and iron-sulfur cluster
VKKIDCRDGKITGVWVHKVKTHASSLRDIQTENSGLEKFTADYYICAVPVEVAAPLLLCDILKPGETIQDFRNTIMYSEETKKTLADPAISMMDIVNAAIQKAAIMKADPTLTGIIELSNDVSWMTGVQFYLEESVDLNKGHIIFSDSKWAVTAISQSQFWPNFPMDKYADGKVKTILSTDVSDWDTPGILYNLPAKQCTPEEIKNEVWEQMKRSLVIDGTPLLRDEMIHTWFIDRDIVFNSEKIKQGDYLCENKEPLLVNKVDTWRLRPESHCTIPNLFFAADYVRTHTDLATMEGANEAGRRAVNNIIEASGSDAALCKIWDLQEPWELALYRWHDYRRYQRGLVWNEAFPWWVKLLQWITSLFRKGAKKSSSKKSTK